MHRKKQPPSRKSETRLLKEKQPYYMLLLIIVLLGPFCFQLGLIFGSERERQHLLDRCTAASSSLQPPPPPPPSTTGTTPAGLLHLPLENEAGGVAAAARVIHRNDFIAALEDMGGLPFDMTTSGSAKAKDVLLLYTSKTSVPINDRITQEAIANTTSSTTTTIPAAKAIENCQSMKVLYTDANVKSSCIAIMEFHEAFHVHRFHRVPVVRKEKEEDTSALPPPLLPLRHVSQSIDSKGKFRGKRVVSRQIMDQYWKDLVHYLTHLPAALERLAPIARNAAAGNNHFMYHQADGNNNSNAQASGSGGGGGVVVAMAVNYGQSEVFVNFVCAARARHIDLSHVILFASDTETVQLAQSLHIHVFDAQEIYDAAIPTQAAGMYGDRNFGRIVLSKIYCVHLLVLLGYDVLLQDVDVVWYRDPLQFFTGSATAKQYDMIFQDDGSRLSRYAPFFGNTGCYFVRNNERTVVLYNHLIRMGDVIQNLKCDQQGMRILLNEHVSWTGLRVKTLQRDSELGLLFPGGFHFHQRSNFMKQLMNGTVEPYVFHMSWTTNKEQKQKFLQQMGEWYVQPECTDNKSNVHVNGVADGAALCCTSEPLVQCHYRDTVSKMSCHDSEALVAGRKSFWS